MIQNPARTGTQRPVRRHIAGGLRGLLHTRAMGDCSGPCSTAALRCGGATTQPRAARLRWL